MKFVGAHVSIAGGVENAPLNAYKIGAKAFAMFTRNQRQWESKPYSDTSIKQFQQRLKKFGFNNKYILPHASYLINLCSPEKQTLEKSRNAFLEELKKVEQLGLNYLNIHPGAHKNKISLNDCLKMIAENINQAIYKTKYATVILENTAGEGSVVGYKFEHLAKIIDQIEDKSRIGVCIDTCHLFAAGYDLRTKKAFEETFKEFDKIIGFRWLKGMHLNDAKSKFASRVDRHESIGKGNIGIKAFKLIMNDDKFNNIPLILETPNNKIWPEEIKMLYSFVGKTISNTDP